MHPTTDHNIGIAANIQEIEKSCAIAGCSRNLAAELRAPAGAAYAANVPTLANGQVCETCWPIQSPDPKPARRVAIGRRLPAVAFAAVSPGAAP